MSDSDSDDDWGAPEGWAVWRQSIMQNMNFRRMIGLEPPLTAAELASLSGLMQLCQYGAADLHLPLGSRRWPTPSVHGCAVIIQRAWRAFAWNRRTRASMLCVRRLGLPGPIALLVARHVRDGEPTRRHDALHGHGEYRVKFTFFHTYARPSAPV